MMLKPNRAIRQVHRGTLPGEKRTLATRGWVIISTMQNTPAVGDVFRLRIDPQRVGYGQVIGVYQRSAYYFAIYEAPHDETTGVDVADIVGGEIALFALSLDALLHHGRWEIVGHAPLPPITWPVYKEATGDGSFVAVDHTGRVLRELDEVDASELRFRSVVAPIRVQNAFAALHGAGSWNSKYDELRYHSSLG